MKPEIAEKAKSIVEAYMWDETSDVTTLARAIAQALLDAEQRGRREMLPLVEQAYRDGLTYATICEVEDKDLAWEQSSIRAKMQAKLGEVQK